MLMGDSCVGKAQLLQTYVDSPFGIPQHFSTTGIHFEYKTIRIGDATVKLRIWYSGTYASAITLKALFFAC